jgi:hypothetical protein
MVLASNALAVRDTNLKPQVADLGTFSAGESQAANRRQNANPLGVLTCVQNPHR